jgi:glutamine amidotransferase
LPNGEQNIGPLKSFNDSDYFYFVHSYYVQPSNDNDIYTTTEYGGNEFCSSILKENIFACQFHPEKSGENGLRILNEMFN